MPTLTFTAGADNYVSSGSTNPDDPLTLYVLGGNDSLRTIAGATIASAVTAGIPTRVAAESPRRAIPGVASVPSRATFRPETT